MATRTIVATMLAVALASTAATAQPSPVPPSGAAPSGTTSLTPPGQADLRPGTPPATGPATSNGQVGEDQVRAQLASAGYTDVRDLQREPNGGWRARAMRDGQQMAVSVDSQGRVVPGQ
jgi:hypothetical protein